MTPAWSRLLKVQKSLFLLQVISVLVKEANLRTFLKLRSGPSFCLRYSNGQYIVAGSDDGSFFIWDRATTNIVRVLRGDDSIVNCLEPHPATCLLATSGIDPVVRLWSPRPEVTNATVVT